MHEGWNSHLQNYSPLHARHYIRMASTELLYPAKFALRRRDQAWWNLIWLTSPEVDDALAVIDEETLSAHHNKARKRHFDHYIKLRRLLQVADMNRGVTLAYALTRMPAEEFVEHFATRPYQNTEPFLNDDGRLLETMRRRAHFSKIPRLRWKTGLTGREARTIGVGEISKYIAASEQARADWLSHAYKLFCDHIRSCGLRVPTARFEMDRFSLSRYGCCFRSQDGVNRIAISPMYVDCEDLMRTFAHEVVHAIDDCQNGHYPKFFEIANQLGFTGTRLDRSRPGKELDSVLQHIREKVGRYPHFAVRNVIA